MSIISKVIRTVVLIGLVPLVLLVAVSSLIHKLTKYTSYILAFTCGVLALPILLISYWVNKATCFIVEEIIDREGR